MQYVNLGRSGLKVSRLCLGCMSFGDAGKGGHEWTLDEASSRPFFAQALKAGINFLIRRMAIQRERRRRSPAAR